MPSQQVATVQGSIVSTVATIPTTISAGTQLLTVRLQANQAVASVTYGGVPMTLIASVDNGTARSQIYGRTTPPEGTADLVITPGVNSYFAWAIDQWVGIRTSAPFGTPATYVTEVATTSHAYTVPSPVGSLAIDVMGLFRSGPYTVTNGVGQIEDMAQQSGSEQTKSRATHLPGTGTPVSISYATSLETTARGVAVALQGAQMAKFGGASVSVFLADGISLLGMKAKELATEEEAVQEDTTGLGDDWAEFTPTGSRIARLSQGEAFYDTGAGNAHEVFRASQSTSRIVSYAFEGDVIGAPFIGHEGTFGVKYRILAQNGLLTKAQTEYLVSGAREEGVILQDQTPQTVDWTTEGADSVDNGVSTPNGGAGYQHVVEMSGVTGFVGTIRHSADDAVYADLITFTNVTASPEAQRADVAGTVNRHLAFSGDVTGVGSITVFVGLARR